jgi:hypothetical protein
MAKAKRESAGRPEAIIDWDLVSQKLIAGCTGVGIAKLIGISYDTLSRQCRNQHNMDFAAYRQQKKAVGDAMLQEVMFDCAMAARFDAKYIAAAIFLAKARLKMTDKPEEKKESNLSINVVTVPKPDETDRLQD